MHKLCASFATSTRNIPFNANCQARLHSAEIRLGALICMLEENLEKQENDQKKRQQQSESNKIANK